MRPNAMLLFVFLPVAAAALIPVIEKAWKGLADFMANAVAVALLALAIAFVAPVRITGPMTLNFSELFQFSMTFYLDSLSLLMLLVINGIALMALIYSIEYMKEYGGKDRYFALFLLMLAGMNGVVLSHDLFGLYVFLEVAACSSYVLVAFGLKHEELEAAFKYLILAAAASALILLAIALIYARTGNLDMKLASDGINFSIYQGDKAVSFMIVLLIVGFGLKMAMVPFHAWLPDAHPSAPAPISAMLSGVLIKASGVYALMRILYNVFGLHTLPKVGFALMGLGVRHRRHPGPGPDRFQTAAGLLQHRPDRLYPARVRYRHAAGAARRALPPDEPRYIQEPALFELGRGSAADSYPGPEQNGRPGEAHADYRADLAGRLALDFRRAAVQRLCQQTDNHRRGN